MLHKRSLKKYSTNTGMILSICNICVNYIWCIERLYSGSYIMLVAASDFSVQLSYHEKTIIEWADNVSVCPTGIVKIRTYRLPTAISSSVIHTRDQIHSHQRLCQILPHFLYTWTTILTSQNIYTERKGKHKNEPQTIFDLYHCFTSLQAAILTQLFSIHLPLCLWL